MIFPIFCSIHSNLFNSQYFAWGSECIDWSWIFTYTTTLPSPPSSLDDNASSHNDHVSILRKSLFEEGGRGWRPERRGFTTRLFTFVAVLKSVLELGIRTITILWLVNSGAFLLRFIIIIIWLFPITVFCIHFLVVPSTISIHRNRVFRSPRNRPITLSNLLPCLPTSSKAIVPQHLRCPVNTRQQTSFKRHRLPVNILR